MKDIKKLLAEASEVDSDTKVEAIRKIAMVLDSGAIQEGRILSRNLLNKMKEGKDTTKARNKAIDWYSRVFLIYAKEYGIFETVDIGITLAKNEGVGETGIAFNGLDKFLKEYEKMRKN